MISIFSVCEFLHARLANLQCLTLFSESDYNVDFLIFDKNRFLGSFWYVVCICLYDVLVT